MDVYAESLDVLTKSECIRTSGTALDVAPASTLLTRSKATIVDFNTKAPQSGLVDYWVKGKAEETLKDLTVALVEHYCNTAGDV